MQELWFPCNDDLLVAGKPEFLHWASKCLEDRFGKLKKSVLPMAHTGLWRGDRMARFGCVNRDFVKVFIRPKATMDAEEAITRH